MHVRVVITVIITSVCKANQIHCVGSWNCNENKMSQLFSDFFLNVISGNYSMAQ